METGLLKCMLGRTIEETSQTPRRNSETSSGGVSFFGQSKARMAGRSRAAAVPHVECPGRGEHGIGLSVFGVAVHSFMGVWIAGLSV